jgi:hypothetical protein
LSYHGKSKGSYGSQKRLHGFSVRFTGNSGKERQANRLWLDRSEAEEWAKQSPNSWGARVVETEEGPLVSVINNDELAQMLADAYAQDWVGTEDFSEWKLDAALSDGFLTNKHQNGHDSKDKHYWISEKGLNALKLTNFPFGSGSAIDTRKIHFNKHTGDF